MVDQTLMPTELIRRKQTPADVVSRKEYTKLQKLYLEMLDLAEDLTFRLDVANDTIDSLLAQQDFSEEDEDINTFRVKLERGCQPEISAPIFTKRKFVGATFEASPRKGKFGIGLHFKRE